MSKDNRAEVKKADILVCLFHHSLPADVEKQIFSISVKNMGLLLHFPPNLNYTGTR